jgi:uncharacterized protein with ParB-like and HNH nuclease domain
MSEAEPKWFDDYDIGDEEIVAIDEYEITAIPNDFNILTIYNFVESKTVKIPGFQRNFVWDIGRASKLIESLILGLPVPQLFLYEESRNSFLVIDGQQRLMSIFYFIKQKFPRKEKRVELRKIFEIFGTIPEHILNDDDYFTDFKLVLPEKLPEIQNKFKGLKYTTLGDFKSQFELRPVRNIIIKQNKPEDYPAIYEIFNRLNSGGMNLTPQEIRNSIYHSPFYEMLFSINDNERWRTLLNQQEPDIHLKDIEILLRSFAMLMDGDNYTPSLTRFLNQFSKNAMKLSDSHNDYMSKLFNSFMESTSNIPNDIFINKSNYRFNIALFESTFAGLCKRPFTGKKLIQDKIDAEKITLIGTNDDFTKATRYDTTSTANVKTRLEVAQRILENSH